MLILKIELRRTILKRNAIKKKNLIFRIVFLPRLSRSFILPEQNRNKHGSHYYRSLCEDSKIKNSKKNTLRF